MRTRIVALVFCTLLLLLVVSHWHTAARPATSKVIPAPTEVLGFNPGDDRKLASWNQVLQYFEALAKTSDRVKFETLGKSTLGKPFVLATISDPQNLARLDEYRSIQASLADPRKLGPARLREPKAAELIKRGKTIVLITCGIHSTEVGSYLSSMLIAHRLASSNEPEIQAILQNTIILLVPSLNPDGVDIVKNWYDKTLGTPYEGSSPPELYHKYVGHDNNRDWYAFTQVETQITVDKIHNVWHPQIVHDIHQQGEYGARLFLPPYLPPVEPNVPRQIIKGYTELGSFMARELRAKGFAGITTDSTYDAWTPARAYSHYHAGVRILAEAASGKIASPITVKFDQLRGDEGYNAKKESVNFRPLWRGGEWHLRDITNYLTAGAFELLRHAAANREQWLQGFYEIGKEAVRPRLKGELHAFIIEPSDNFGPLLDILERGGVSLESPGAFTWQGRRYPQGTRVVQIAQPYGGFAKALLESQRYPNLRDATGHPLPPYDVTAHTLPLLMNVRVRPVYTSLTLPKPLPEEPIGWNGGCGDAPDRRAIYHSHSPAMDEGWTKWVLEKQSRCIFHQSITDADIRKGNFGSGLETIIIPDQSPSTILNGHRSGAMPPEYTGGIGNAGVKSLREWVEKGGTLVCLNRASTFAIKNFNLPVRDVVAGLSEKEFFVPGSILRIELDTTHPLAQGMPKESIAWVQDSPVFEVNSTGTAGVSPAVRVVASYPTDKNSLLSGWLLGERRLRRKAALVEVVVGKGRVILFGFRPQYRAQSLATYPLFFNALNGRKELGPRASRPQ